MKTAERRGQPSADEAPLVAIVDDDASVRLSASRLIRSLGYRAEAFGSAEEFLDSGQATETSCLILDVRMPGIDGLELQRRLADYGLSFSGVIDLVRRELAARHIRQRYVTVLEMSDLLGYSELSAFSRAFRRWFGMSPQKFRAKLFASNPAAN